MPQASAPRGRLGLEGGDGSSDVNNRGYHMTVKAAILFLSLCLPVLADLAAGQQAIKNGDYATAPQ